MLSTIAFSQDKNVDDWQKYPGDLNKAVSQLTGKIDRNLHGGIFKAISSYHGIRSNKEGQITATRILALYRIGKLSAHSEAVKKAFVYQFFTAFKDVTRHHEALELYDNIVKPNATTPFWRIIQARCAKALFLPETPELYKKIAEEMRQVPPSEEVKVLWQENKNEFDIPDHTLNLWEHQTTQFVMDATGFDIPAPSVIVGNPFPYVSLEGSLGPKAVQWSEILDSKVSIKAAEFDELIAQASKVKNLQWINGRGFINSRIALRNYLLSKPADDLRSLRDIQELKYNIAIKKASIKPKTIELFRRYPWSISAQKSMLNDAKKHIFKGEAHAAYRSYQDILTYTVDKNLRESAQVGLWLSLSQVAPEKLAESFKSVKPDSMWPWHGCELGGVVLSGSIRSGKACPIGENRALRLLE